MCILILVEWCLCQDIDKTNYKTHSNRMCVENVSPRLIPSVACIPYLTYTCFQFFVIFFFSCMKNYVAVAHKFEIYQFFGFDGRE